MRQIYFCALMLLVLGLSTSARADELLFYNLSGPVSASFELLMNPAVNPTNADVGFGFTITPINLMINGAASSDSLTFYNATPITGAGGGFGAFSSGVADDFLLDGVQLYSGSELTPTMLVPGIQPILLTGFDDLGAYALTVQVVGTPEPSLLLMLVVGFFAWSVVYKCRRTVSHRH